MSRLALVNKPGLDNGLQREVGPVADQAAEGADAQVHPQGLVGGTPMEHGKHSKPQALNPKPLTPEPYNLELWKHLRSLGRCM